MSRAGVPTNSMPSVMPIPSTSSPSSQSTQSSSSSWTFSVVSLPATQQGRILLTAIASCTITAASIFSYQAALRVARRRDLSRKVDRATRRERHLEKKLQSPDLLGIPGAHDDDESIDGGTPRYLEHLARLTPSRSNTNLAGGYKILSPLRRQTSRSSMPGIGATSSSKLNSTDYDESLIREQLSRNFSFVGDDAMKKLREAFVVVLGLGGVGSHVALSLIRSGVGHIRLIDFDQVSLSSLNRHAVATLKDVGRPKVVACQEHFRDIAPWVHIQAWVEIFNECEARRLLSPFRLPGSLSQNTKEVPLTYVIDCIDNLNTKVGLLAYCHEQGIKVFSSMGAGAKCDPTRICIGDLTATGEDPLAKSVRRRLRERGIPQVLLQEKGSPGKPLRGQRPQQRKKVTRPPETPPRKFSISSAPQPHSTQVTPRPAASAWNDKAKTVDTNPTSPTSRSRAASQSDGLIRASSASSFGSGEGAFYTPGGTPREENVNCDTTVDGPLPELRLERASSENDEVAGPRQAHRSAEATQIPLNQLNGPTLRFHHSSSGLESLSPSPLTEMSEAEAQSYSEGYTIDSTPEFAPSSIDATEDAGKNDRNLWKREMTRRNSTSPQADAHRLDGPNSGADRTALATHSAKLQLPDINGDRSASSSTSDEGDAASTVVLPASESGWVTSDEPPWTSQNPRYLMPCIFSTEKPSAQLLPLDEAELAKDGGAEMLRALEDENEWRVRTLPVFGPLPAIFGLSIAAFVLCDMAGREDLMEPLQNKLRRRSGEKTLRELEALENNYPSSAGGGGATSGSSTAYINRNHLRGRGIPFLLDDVLYIVTEVFRCRSVIPPFPSVANASLVRWDSTLPLSYQNVALLTREQARKHAQEVLKKGKSPAEVWGREAMEHWRKRMEEERWYARLR